MYLKVLITLFFATLAAAAPTEAIPRDDFIPVEGDIIPFLSGGVN